MIPLMQPVMTGEMIKAATDALANERLIMGESVYKFEEEFAKYIGTDFAVAVNSGTFALQTAIMAADIKHRVIATTPTSFIATSNAIVHSGNAVSFRDIDYNTGNINPENVENANAILPVHLYGKPCDMDKLLEVKERTGAVIIEDACQAHGAEYNGQKIGSIGDAGCFSFYSTKNMTVGTDGGIVTTNNIDIAKNIDILRNCGRINQNTHSMIGYTGRMSTVAAAIGRVQLRYLDEWNIHRKEIAELYKSILPEEILFNSEDSVHHIFAIHSADRDTIAEYLNINDIQTGIHYPIPIHLQPCYSGKDGQFPNAEKFAKETLSLPMSAVISKDDIKYVCEKVLEVI